MWFKLFTIQVTFGDDPFGVGSWGHDTNLGMTVSRPVWRSLLDNALEFCSFDDYNWDLSLERLRATEILPVHIMLFYLFMYLFIVSIDSLNSRFCCRCDGHVCYIMVCAAPHMSQDIRKMLLLKYVPFHIRHTRTQFMLNFVVFFW